MTDKIELQRVYEWGWLCGFSNLFRKEHQAWWGTRRWWINGLAWTLILGGLVANMLFVPTLTNLASPEAINAAGGVQAYAIQMGLSVFFEFGVQVVAIGAIILTQDALIDERISGVTEWILSKPVARRAYPIAKLIANLLYISLFLVILPAVVVYGLLYLHSKEPFPLVPFLTGVSLMLLHLLFYKTLTLMLGAFFGSRAPVLAISMGILLGGGILGSLVRPLLSITPWMLAQIASGAASQTSLPGNLIWPPVAATGVWCVVFVLTTLYKFDRTEF
jgi:ABC-type transport system involved in multi-copper enzyme maturation permease subunit